MEEALLAEVVDHWPAQTRDLGHLRRGKGVQDGASFRHRFGRNIIEIIVDFDYIFLMSGNAEISKRSGARRMSDVPTDVLAHLAAGRIETVNLMEWLAADMAALARSVSAEIDDEHLSRQFRQAADEMVDASITGRLKIGGRVIAAGAPPGSSIFELLKQHKSDLVRQWCCYAVNDSGLSLTVRQRLQETLPFAADRNMSVRETAWMAYRPYVAAHLELALPLLETLAVDEDANIRRFAVEVTRPRSVWGAHLAALKRDPNRARGLLERVRADSSRYVRLAVGNWLNDASKSQPDWVADLCAEWNRADDPNTRFITQRGLRTITRVARSNATAPSLPFARSHLTRKNPELAS
jgi:3-methyladenine DNA glycosylase AlkC